MHNYYFFSTRVFFFVKEILYAHTYIKEITINIAIYRII